MRSRKRTSLVNLGFHAWAIGMVFVSGVVLVPLYLRHIPIDLYGAWLASGNILTWVTLADPGVSLVLQQRVATAYGAGDRTELVGWIATGLWTTVAISAVIIACGIVSSWFLPTWLALSSAVDQQELVDAFRWSVVGSALMVMSFSVTSVNQGLQSSLGIGTIYVAASLFRLAAVIALLGWGFGLLAIAIPSVGMGLILLCANVVYMLRRFRREGISFQWAPVHFKQLAGLLSWTSFGRLSAVMTSHVDLFVVARFLGPESVSVLRFTRTAPEISRLLIERPIAALQPSLAHLMGAGGDGRARIIVVSVTRGVVHLLALLAGGLVLLNDDFVRLWLGTRFYAGAETDVLIIFFTVASTGAAVLSGFCFSAGNIRGASAVGVAQTLLYLPLLGLSGYWFGLPGVVGAGVLSVLATQGLYLPGALWRLYQLGTDDRLSTLRALLASGVAAVVPLICLWGAHPMSWLSLLMWASAYSLCYLFIVFGLSPDLRRDASNASNWLSEIRRTAAARS